jgi:hypothetical protein
VFYLALWAAAARLAIGRFLAALGKRDYPRSPESVGTARPRPRRFVAPLRCARSTRGPRGSPFGTAWLDANLRDEGPRAGARSGERAAGTRRRARKVGAADSAASTVGIPNQGDKDATRPRPRNIRGAGEAARALGSREPRQSQREAQHGPLHGFAQVLSRGGSAGGRAPSVPRAVQPSHSALDSEATCLPLTTSGPNGRSETPGPHAPTAGGREKGGTP